MMWKEDMDRHYRRLRMRAFYWGAFYASSLIFFVVWAVSLLTKGACS